jgi:DNA polymerase-3 subunit alpha
VAQIITFGRMAARAVVRDVGRALEYPYSYCDKIAKLIPFGFTLDDTLKKVPEFREIYESDEKAKRLINYAKKLEGVARHASTHACGVVVSKEPLENLVPLQYSPQSENTVITQYEMRAIENLGLLKIDLLGLKNLTIIEDTLSKIYAIYGKNLEIDKIPLDDKKTFKLLENGDTVGVFQLESEGMRRYLKQLKPTNIEDIIALLALYRPGPMQFIPDYIQGKHKKKKIEYLHPKLKPILESTYGIILYQEQVMKIAQELAGFTLAEADVLRKAIGKKIKSLLLAQKEKFISGCKKNEIPEEVAQKIWNWIEPFARYSFNRSHSVAYAQIAYQTAYLKAHYPVEFMAALLTSEKNDVERIGFLISECQKMGIEVLPPDINESFRNFSVVPKEKKIRFGLLAIKNVGENVVEAIISERKKNGPFLSFSDFISRIDSKDLNKKSLEALIKAGVFDRFEERNTLLNNLEEILNFNREIKRGKENGQKSLFENNTQNASLTLKLKTSEPADLNSKLLWEKELLGLYISSHPLEKYRNILEKRTIKISDLNSTFRGAKVRIAGVIDQIKRILTRNGNSMLFVNIEDFTGKLEIVVFPDLLERHPEVFQKNKVVIATGRLDDKDGIPKLICETVEEIIES